MPQYRNYNLRMIQT